LLTPGESKLSPPPAAFVIRRRINEGFAALKSGTPVRQLIDFAI